MRKRSFVTRRNFLHKTSMAGAAAVAGALAPVWISRGADSPNNRVRVGVIGLGRGMDHVAALLQIPSVEIAYLADIDDIRLDRGIKIISDKSEQRPKRVKDFRKILDDREVDAVFIATPNHWHAPATILSCTAGKHVYVEKPGSQNPYEGEMMVAAAQKFKRTVQMGNQRRSWPAVIEAVEKLRSGVIGKVHFARCWYNNARGTIGRGKPITVPANLDYSMWQGPAPEKPYVDNLVHYNWHWRWHWGNGELGNNGIHALDLVRWGLGVDYPRKITYNGGRYAFEDDQETPDTGVATYDFGESGASWDGSSCHPRPNESGAFVTFYGAGGSLANIGGGYKVFDLKGKEIEKGSGPGGEKGHIENFLECLRSGKSPRSEISDAQKSTLLCHLGNISYRTGHTVHFDPARLKIIDDKEAEKLWRREYRKGWEPKV